MSLGFTKHSQLDLFMPVQSCSTVGPLQSSENLTTVIPHVQTAEVKVYLSGALVEKLKEKKRAAQPVADSVPWQPDWRAWPAGRLEYYRVDPQSNTKNVVCEECSMVFSPYYYRCPACGTKTPNVPLDGTSVDSCGCLKAVGTPPNLTFEDVPCPDSEKASGLGLPTDDKLRKELQLWTFLMEYFPDAFLAVVGVAVAGNKQHNPGEKLHWNREKSTDQMNTFFRHVWDYGRGVKKDTDGQYHLAKAIWRLCAQLQLDIEGARRDENV